MQHCNNPSGSREMYASGETGVQHRTWFADGLEAETRRTEALAFKTAMMCRLPEVGGVRLARFDTSKLLGAMVDGYEESELLRRFQRRVARAADGWKGEDPVRSLQYWVYAKAWLEV